MVWLWSGGRRRGAELTGECGGEGGATSVELALSMPCTGNEGGTTRLAPTGGRRSSSEEERDEAAELVDSKSPCVQDAARGNKFVVSVTWRAQPCARGVPHSHDPSTVKRRPVAPGARCRSWYQWRKAHCWRQSARNEAIAYATVVL